MKNLLLTDFPTTEDWEFVQALKTGTNSNWEIAYKDGRTRVPKYKRLLNYIFFPLYVFLKYDAKNIVSYQQFYGLFYVFYSKLFFFFPNTNSVNLYILTFIYKKKSNIVGFLYKKWMKFVLNSDIIKNVVVYSQSEIDYYSKVFPFAKDKFKAIPYAINYISKPRYNELLKKEKYIFSTGNSNRDYQFLVDIINKKQYKLKIASKGLLIKHGANIDILQNVFGEEMYNYMYNCYLVAIPLKDLNISSGQSVILQAMQLGKPIIITNNKSIYDYVDDGCTGWIVENDENKWIEKIEYLYMNSDAYNTMARAEREKFLNKFTIETFGNNVAKLIMQDLKI